MPKQTQQQEDTANLFQRGGKGPWYFRFQGENRDVRRSLRTSDLEEARRRLKALVAEKKAKDDLVKKLAGGEMPWPLAIGRFILEGGTTIKPSTMKRYQVSIRQLDPFFKEFSLHEITYSKITDYITERRLQKTNITNATLNRDITALSRILAYGLHWKVCTENPAMLFDRKLATKEIRETRYLPTPEEVAKASSEAYGMFGSAIMFSYLTGARQSEVCNLRWKHITIKSKKSGFAELWVTKKKFRTIKLSVEAIALIQSLEQVKGNPVVFRTENGGAYSQPSSLFARVTKEIRDADPEFPKFTFHDLRHAYAVRELRAGKDIYDLSRHLGHSSVKVTEGYLGYVAGGSAVSRWDMDDEGGEDENDGEKAVENAA